MNKIYWGELCGSNKTLEIINFCKKNNSVVLFIADNIKDEHQILNELNFYTGDLKVLHFANYEILPFDSIAPHQDIISNRIKTLNTLTNTTKNTIVVTTIESLLTKLSPKEFIQQNNLHLKVGDILNLTTFSTALINSTYLKVNTVTNKGEFSIRGEVIDIYPVSAKNGIRINLFDNEIENINLFDISTQLSIKEIKTICLLNAKEFPFDMAARNKFLKNYYQYFNTKDRVYNAIDNNRIPNGIEFYLPLFFDNTNSLLDYLPDNSLIYYKKYLSNKVDDILQQINAAHLNAKSIASNNILKVDNVYYKKNELFATLNKFKQIIYQTNKTENGNNFSNKILPSLLVQHNSLIKLENFLTNITQKVLILCNSIVRTNILLNLLKIAIKPVQSYQEFNLSTAQINIIAHNINGGFITKNIVIITENDIFGNTVTTQKTRQKSKHKDFNEAIANIIEIKKNDLVVHEYYGIGRYLGLQIQEIDAVKNDFISIVYDGGSKLMLPVDDINLISRYYNSNNTQLHKLGGQAWAKIKKRAVESMRDIASELLEIYANRELSNGFANQKPTDAYNNFVANFKFEETKDQTTAIAEVLADMLDKKPMDRLICGDVGFGKTEIAMRSAFIAVENNSQVILLVPTTLLANQHYHSFIDRFNNYAINIAVLSRFQSVKEQQQIKTKLADGKIDIIIGTHKLLQKNIKYKNLGLIIIDEEHRFGVSQKEQLKSLRYQCDILSMSATPIPRTLNLTLGSLRDISIINTPPKGRVAIKTLLCEFNKKIIKEAIHRELHRDGQVFFLHNDINSINNIANYLTELFNGNIKIRVAHGKMPNNELNAIMDDFYHQRFNILVCSTIIETGIDIPTANTIIINDANNFGLSQLHQLRGRVGRSHHKAYAYLLVKSLYNLNEKAKKRLDAISSLEELGSGFMIANHDLEIRGAGDILGKKQSGKISEIGFNLYYDLLDRTITSLKAGKDIDLSNNKVTIDTGISCIIPDSYIADICIRLSFYRKINTAKDEELKDLQMELIDRFGMLPDSVKNLFAKHLLKNICLNIGVHNINMFKDRVIIIFNEHTAINFNKMIAIIQTQTQNYKLKNNSTLIYINKMPADINRILIVEKILLQLKN